MKTRIILGLSLTANLVCLSIFIERGPTMKQTQAADSPDDISASAIQQSLRPSLSAPSPEASPPVSTSAAAPAFRWSQIESTNYSEFIANLRAIGCPEQTIADIISADLRGALQTASGAAEVPAADVHQLTSRLLNPRVALRSSQLNFTPGPGLLAAAADSQEVAVAAAPGAAEVPAQHRWRGLEVAQRLWMTDSIRSGYGLATLLELQRSAAQERMTLEAFVQSRHVSLPPPPRWQAFP